MRIAVLDIGTNTFNLLIVDTTETGGFNKVFNEKLAPKIGLGGINHRQIVPDAFERGIQSLVKQQAIIESYKPDKIYAFGTSALRNAANGADFVEAARARVGMDIHVISGDREAELIFYGNRHAVDFGDDCVLILDIGGGSNEFIIANKSRIFWKQSFEIGMSRLLQKFTPSDPFTKADIRQIEAYVDPILEPLYKAVDLFPVNTLVGSSGSFDTFRSMIRSAKGLGKSDDTSYLIDYDDFLSLHHKLVTYSQADLVTVPGMDPMRVDMLGIASVFVHFITRKFRLTKIIQSTYSLKEGVIFSIDHRD